MNIAELKLMANQMRQEYGLLPKQIIGVQKEAVFVPLSIFSCRKLGCLEALVRYLHEDGMSFAQIAKTLNRDQRTIWTSYNNAAAKFSGSLDEQEGHSPMINIEIFKERRYGVLKTLVLYCKLNLCMKNVAIAKALNRDPRTISSVLRIQ